MIAGVIDAPATALVGCCATASALTAAEVTVTVWETFGSPVEDAVMSGVPASVSRYRKLTVLAPSGMITLVIAAVSPVLRNVPVAALSVTTRAPTVVALLPASWR